MLTEEEKIILKNTDKKWRYIAREDWNYLYIYTSEPKKHHGGWVYSCYICERADFDAFSELFQSVQWTDREPLEFRNKKGEFIL